MIRYVTVKTLSTLLAGCGVGLFPALSFGLGLGDIEIQSRLNQPLHARIEIVDVTDEEWQQIRARIAPQTLMSEASAHPEILASLTLRAVQDARHEHFIEVRSDEPLTEPLFDLPVQVSGQSLQLVRNYSVLLDPASAEDSPRSAQAPALVKTESATAPRVANTVDAQARVARHKSRGLRIAHSTAPRKAAIAAEAAPAAAPADSAPKAAEQQRLETQLASLQDTLTRMQATIATQDAMIAKLTAQITARSNTQTVAPRQPTQQVQSVATESALADDPASDERPSLFQRWRKTIYWIAGVGASVVILAMGAVAFVRRRNANALREIARQEAARRNTPPRQEPASDPLAWQTNLRAAQTGTWQAPASPPPPEPVARQPVAEPASEDTVATTVAIEELTQDLQADLEALNASYEVEKVHSSSEGIDAWRVQGEMLERDFLADTEALPLVQDSGKLTVEKTETDAPDDAVSGRGSRNREVVEILEQSLDFAPGRVDIQLKLLEIYHHEALGSRDQFDAMLRKLAADPRQLSPSQQRHVEMLQRTLRDGKLDTDSDFVAEVAM
jgi:hypothetical protein